MTPRGPVAAFDPKLPLAHRCPQRAQRYVQWMRRLVQLVDQDVVASLNKVRRTTNLPGMLAALYAPRLTWVRLVAPLLVCATPLLFLRGSIQAYWLFGCLGLIAAFFGLYFYRFAVIRQRWLNKRQVDEFGSYTVSPDDLYEVPPS
jgi:sterol desaturase/sphingolipid hydroxylase (fatty acid hydroxylase superfamily)